jgi:outer membrane protein assembly factor BamE (lipoprotein component of BamABCDE complex)
MSAERRWEQALSQRNGGRRVLQAAMALLLGLGLSACVATFRNHGYIPPEADLAQIEVGVATREDVIALVGRPTTGGVLNDDGFYFVQSRFRHYGAFAPQEIEREILAITFDEAGLVRNIERFGLEDGQVVTLSRRVTDDNVRDTTFIRQLLGAIGNFDAGRFIGSE